jgi:hypothetical protein
MEAVILWLKTPEGEAWSHYRITVYDDQGGNPVRHSSGVFAAVKYDHEGCSYDEINGFRDCGPPNNNFTYTDAMIKQEMRKYGMNGVPTYGEPTTDNGAA